MLQNEHIDRARKNVIAALPAIRSGSAAVDESGEFPAEAMDLLREHGLLGLLVPVRYGGLGGDLGDLVALAGLLASGCTSTALIWAMHCQQVECIARFGDPELCEDLLPRIASGDIYIASVTSGLDKAENSFTGEATAADGLRFYREAPIVTGGAHADGFLMTMRESAGADDNRITLCYAHRAQMTVEKISEWNALGMRGTDSIGIRLSGSISGRQVVGGLGNFRTVATECLIPAAHLSWSAVWLGAARGVLSEVLNMVRARGARQGSELVTERVARARMDIEVVAAYLAVVRDEVMGLRAQSVSLKRTPTQIHLNNLKVVASELTFRAVDELMQVAGMSAGYRRDSDIAVERVFRDLRSARLNFSNDGLLMTNGKLTLLDRDVTVAPDDLF